jgi:hypothetical protein
MRMIILIVLIFVTSSFRKEETNKFLSVAELLTQKPWILTSYGTDANENGLIDAGEESIKDCQKDNTWHYYMDGTGSFEDNFLSCANGIDQLPFTWKLLRNETTIDFFFDSLKILHLNEQELMLHKELNDANGHCVKFIMAFKH